MKIKIFCATVAISCCGLSSSYAQVRVLGGYGHPTPAPQLVSDLTDIGDDLLDDGLGEITEAANPFDFLPDQDAPDTPLQVQQPSRPTVPPTNLVPPTNSAPRPPATDFFSDGGQNKSDPHSLPVGRHHQRTIVDTIVDHAAVDSIPHAAFAPVAWAPPRGPQPVADILLRERCVDGLWAGYQQQREQECATMWAHLNGQGHCGRCGHGGCQSGHAGSTCDVCGPAAHAGPRNRYLEKAHRGCGCANSSCAGTCATGDCAAGACATGQCDSISAATGNPTVLSVSQRTPADSPQPIQPQFGPYREAAAPQAVSPAVPQGQPANVARLLPHMMR